MRFAAALASLLAATTLAACGASSPSPVSRAKEAWNPANDPLRLAADFQRNLNSLPVRGEIDKKPWSDTYWPSFQGGIAHRWNDPAQPDAFTTALYTQAEVAALPPERIAQLSPAEKYDLYIGNYAYPLTMNQRTINHASDPQWYGYCHGWSPAALNYDEPKPVTLTSRDGVPIAFGSSDVKALLLFTQQYQRAPQDTHFMGARCNVDIKADPSHANDPACRDTNPGSFHLALANMLGVRKQGLVADVSRDIQVWNQPVYGFSSVIGPESDEVYASAAPGTAKIVEVTTTMSYVTEFGPRWEASPAAEFPNQLAQGQFHYHLELNAAGEVIGGEWLDDNRPDFLWTQSAPVLHSYDFLAKVAAIYTASVAAP